LHTDYLLISTGDSNIEGVAEEDRKEDESGALSILPDQPESGVDGRRASAPPYPPSEKEKTSVLEPADPAGEV